MNKIILEVTQNIINRSKDSREVYLKRVEELSLKDVNRSLMGCSNIAHTIAPMNKEEKKLMQDMKSANIAIITSYNDMLSAHEPFKLFPPLIKRTLLSQGATAQVSSGVPAMCDGVTQGFEGMELSLFSRDNIAMATAIGLSHNVYDGAIYLGVCDKIVPGLLIGALSFGHLPAIFMPAGPMHSGISNKEKASIRQEFAQGKVTKDELLKVESASYHSSGTCTFYGTANSNQMLLEMMGLQLPNSSFVNANTQLRDELTQEASKRLLGLTKFKNNYTPISKIVNEKSFVNAIVGLMATGGSTNHTIHLIAMARAAGIIINWDDFNLISSVTPLICRLYPNGNADVNHFRDAGGMSVVIHQLIEAGLVHEDVNTVVGFGLKNYIVEPSLKDNSLVFNEGAIVSRDKEIISSTQNSFAKEGGIVLLEGNLGRSIIKTSALNEENFLVRAPAIVFSTQEELKNAFANNLLNKDFVAVVKFQGPKANGMPELHGLLPSLGVLQDKGFKVAIVTDGRMSGASGKVPSAIHLVKEAAQGGLINKIEDGDIICLDVKNRKLNLEIKAQDMIKRENKKYNLSKNHYNFGRNLFSKIRLNVTSAEEGATIFDIVGDERS
jgi:phosphogluconate dehydratase